MMLAGHTTSSDITASDAPADSLLLSQFSFPATSMVSKLSAKLDGNGSVDGNQQFRGVIYDSTGALLGTSPIVTIENLSDPAWVDFVFDAPVEVAEATYTIGLLTSGPDDAARYYGSASGSNLAIESDSFSEVTSSGLTPSFSSGELAIFATYAYPWEPPDEDDEYLANLAFQSAQVALGSVGDPRTQARVYASWHGTFLDPAPQGASLAIVQKGGPLTDWVGRRVRVTGRLGRAVTVYIHRETDLDLSDDTQISLTRRAWQELGRLSEDTELVTLEVVTGDE